MKLKWLYYGLLGVLCLGVFYLYLTVMARLPIAETGLALDWKGIWGALHKSLPIYDLSQNMRNSPWSIWGIWLIAQLPLTTSWAIISFLTVMTLVISVPKHPVRKWPWIASVILLSTSFFTLRQIADGNLELVTIAGVLALLHGMKQRNIYTLTLGLILATSKLQGIWILIPVLGIYVLRTWKPTQWLKVLTLTLLVIAPSLFFFGESWLFVVLNHQVRGSIMDSSLLATASRLGISPVLSYGLWTVTFGLTLWVTLHAQPTLLHQKAGALIAASYILSPFMAGNSYLTILAFGVMPLFQANLLLGGLLIAAVNILYFVPPQVFFDWSATYITGLTFLTWLILLVWVQRSERASSPVREAVPTAPALSS